MSYTIQKCHDIGKISTLGNVVPVPYSIWNARREDWLYRNIFVESRKVGGGMLS